jgi:hypothetical protein
MPRIASLLSRCFSLLSRYSDSYRLVCLRVATISEKSQRCSTPVSGLVFALRKIEAATFLKKEELLHGTNKNHLYVGQT